MKLLRILPFCFLCLALTTGCGEDENEYNLNGNKPKPTNNTGGSGTNTGGDDNNGDNGNAQQGNASAEVKEAIKRLEFPKVKDDGNSFVVVHSCKLNDKTGETGINYSVEWDPTIHAQRWCCYQMYSTMLQTNTSRYQGHGGASLSPDALYPNDPFLPSQYQFTVDPFRNSGFDHGHICPSADRQSSEAANYQTFFMTNMMPQNNKFNAGIWASMESKVRDWTHNFDTLYVCKGGTIDRAEYIIKYLGSDQNKIPVPKYFFTALLGKNSQGYAAIGLWIAQNEGIESNANISQFAMTIDELEEKTGLDLFCNLPDGNGDNQEGRVESTLAKSVWGLK